MKRDHSWVFIAPPVEGGVKDHAELLAAELRRQGALVHSLQQVHARSALMQVWGDSVVLLHMSGYGYAASGAPYWLVRHASNWRRQGAIVGVSFHELFASSRPWKRAYWMRSVQQYVCHQLADVADFWIANRHESGRWLTARGLPKPHAVLPVFSNVGELGSGAQSRNPIAVVFGGAALRRATYTMAGEGLFAWASGLGIEVHDIGEPIRDPELTAKLITNGVQIHGHLQAAAAAECLRTARYGLIAYPTDFIAKSGVFAAYCAHGICPIVFDARYAAADGLEVGIHYSAGLPLQESSTGAISRAAMAWYQPHRLAEHAQMLRRLVEEVYAGCGAGIAR